MTNKSGEISDYFEIIRRRLGFILLFPSGLVLVVWLLLALTPDVYQAKVVVHIKIPVVNVDISRYGRVFPKRNYDTYKVMSEKPSVLQKIISQLNLRGNEGVLPMSPVELKKMLFIELPKVNIHKPSYVPPTALVALKVSGVDPVLIKDIANVWAQCLAEESQQSWERELNTITKLFENEQRDKFEKIFPLFDDEVKLNRESDYLVVESDRIKRYLVRVKDRLSNIREQLVMKQAELNSNKKALEEELFLSKTLLEEEAKVVGLERKHNEIKNLLRRIVDGRSYFREFSLQFKAVKLLKFNDAPDVEIINPALAPEAPIGPDRLRYSILAGILGFMFSLGASFVWELGARREISS